MNIAVVGLGLIGGSIAKAIKKYTNHACFGFDADEKTMYSALADGAIDKIIRADELSGADITIICLYPGQIISFAAENIDKFKKGSTVIDTGGIKTDIYEKLEPVFEGSGVDFIGAHPMAGREYSGYAHSGPDLFKNASFIITPYPKTPPEKIEMLKTLTKELGFGKFVVSTPHEHDKIIAYTSQLAHIVSNAYVKSPTITAKAGFHAGSYLDLTRVAKLNEEMWSSLMAQNHKFLAEELKNIIDNLNKYLSALDSGDINYLYDLLKEGRIIKEKSEEI
jgi:prephenate dehydrogenase